jgi:hypothetical protein
MNQEQYEAERLIVDEKQLVVHEHITKALLAGADTAEFRAELEKIVRRGKEIEAQHAEFLAELGRRTAENRASLVEELHNDALARLKNKFDSLAPPPKPQNPENLS